MAIVSPRAGTPQTALDTAASVPLEFHDDKEHRRKLAEAIRALAAYLKDKGV